LDAEIARLGKLSEDLEEEEKRERQIEVARQAAIEATAARREEAIARQREWVEEQQKLAEAKLAFAAEQTRLSEKLREIRDWEQRLLRAQGLEPAVLTIQSTFRMFLSKWKVKRLRSARAQRNLRQATSHVLMQVWLRKAVVRKCADLSRRKNAAALTIGSVWRGNRTRNELHEVKFLASRKIQSAWRSFVAEAIVSSLREEREKQTVEVTKLQAQWRGKKGRAVADAKRLLQAEEHERQVERSHALKIWLRWLFAIRSGRNLARRCADAVPAAKKIQRWYRRLGFIFRMAIWARPTRWAVYLERRTAAMIIQRVFRGFQDRKMLKSSFATELHETNKKIKRLKYELKATLPFHSIPVHSSSFKKSSVEGRAGRKVKERVLADTTFALEEVNMLMNRLVLEVAPETKPNFDGKRHREPARLELAGAIRGKGDYGALRRHFLARREGNVVGALPK
jgi:hypothetical protein